VATVLTAFSGKVAYCFGLKSYLEAGQEINKATFDEIVIAAAITFHERKNKEG
jgi:hypothetical protein